MVVLHEQFRLVCPSTKAVSRRALFRLHVNYQGRQREFLTKVGALSPFCLVLGDTVLWGMHFPAEQFFREGQSSHFIIPQQLKAKGSQPRQGVGVARGSFGVRFDQGSGGSGEAGCKVQVRFRGFGVVWCRPVQARCEVQGRLRRFWRVSGWLAQARCKVQGGSGGYGVVWCRPDVRFKEGSGRLSGSSKVRPGPGCGVAGFGGLRGIGVSEVRLRSNYPAGFCEGESFFVFFFFFFFFFSKPLFLDLVWS